jgi:hypothetical protein
MCVWIRINVGYPIFFKYGSRKIQNNKFGYIHLVPVLLKKNYEYEYPYWKLEGIRIGVIQYCQTSISTLRPCLVSISRKTKL